MTDDEKEGWFDFPNGLGWWWHTTGGWDWSDGITGWKPPIPICITEIHGELALSAGQVVARRPPPDWREQLKKTVGGRGNFGVYPILDLNTGETSFPKGCWYGGRWKQLKLPRLPWWKLRDREEKKRAR